MFRKSFIILPILFVFVFAFAVTLTMHTAARASGPCDYLNPIPGCCILAILCDPGPDHYWTCGYGEWDGNQCVKSKLGNCPAPIPCDIPPR